MAVRIVGVPTKKNLGSNEILPKFCDACPNHDFQVAYFTDGTKKLSEILGRRPYFVLKSW